MRTLVILLASLSVSSIACSKGGQKFDSFEGAITMHTTSAAAPQDMVVEVKKNELRFDTKSPQGDAMHGVFDPTANKVVLYMDATKTYMDMNFAGPSATPNTNPDTSSVNKSGKHETIAGYDCEDWTVNDPSGKKSEVCIAQGLAFFDVGSLRSGSSAASSPLAREFREKKSFPLRSVEYDASGKEISHTEVTKIESKAIDESRFAVPADYTKVTLPH